MAAIARDFDLVFRVFAALAAIVLIIFDDAPARGMGTFLLFMSSHACSPSGLLPNRANFRSLGESQSEPMAFLPKAERPEAADPVEESACSRMSAREFPVALSTAERVVAERVQEWYSAPLLRPRGPRSGPLRFRDVAATRLAVCGPARQSCRTRPTRRLCRRRGSEPRRNRASRHPSRVPSGPLWICVK